MKNTALRATPTTVSILRYDQGRSTLDPALHKALNKPVEKPIEPPFFDADYIRRLAACDQQTEQHFTAHFTDLLKVKLRFRIRSPQAMEDVQQETFLRIFRNLRKNPDAIEHPERLGA